MVMINERCPKVIYKVHIFYLQCNDEIVLQLRYKKDNYGAGLRNICEQTANKLYSIRFGTGQSPAVGVSVRPRSSPPSSQERLGNYWN